MRSARASDYWRRVYERPYHLRLNRFAFRNVLGIGSGEIYFEGGITAICGANGVGKTTLLDALLGALDLSKSVSPPLSKLRLSGAELSATLTSANQDVEINLAFQTNGQLQDEQANEVEVTWTDPARQSRAIITHFAEMANREELLEAYSPRNFSNEEVKLLSYLVGKEYTFCQTFEIEDFDDELTFPYFRVECQGVIYGSETMGLGEMSLHLMFWLLNRVSPNSILLLEEPETHIAPRSQIALLDVLAKFSSERSIWTILTTHSPAIISRVPLKHIRLLYRQGLDIKIVNEPAESQLHSVVGIKPRYSGVLLVEDHAAREFARAWLNKCDPSLLQKLEVIVAGSDGDIIAALNKFPKVGSWLKVVGLFDGDMQSKQESYKWPYTFLPGDRAPEELLRKETQGKAELIAERLARTSDQVGFILAELQGIDHHDWFIEFARHLGISYEHLMSELFLVWLEDTNNLAASTKAYEALIKILELTV